MNEMTKRSWSPSLMSAAWFLSCMTMTASHARVGRAEKPEEFLLRWLNETLMRHSTWSSVEQGEFMTDYMLNRQSAFHFAVPGVGEKQRPLIKPKPTNKQEGSEKNDFSRMQPDHSHKKANSCVDNNCHVSDRKKGTKLDVSSIQQGDENVESVADVPTLIDKVNGESLESVKSLNSVDSVLPGVDLVKPEGAIREIPVLGDSTADRDGECQPPTLVENYAEADELIPVLDDGIAGRARDTKDEEPTLVENFAETDEVFAEEGSTGKESESESCLKDTIRQIPVLSEDSLERDSDAMFEAPAASAENTSETDSFIPAVLKDGSMELRGGAAEPEAPSLVENLSESDELIPVLDDDTVKRVKDTKAEAPTSVENFSETDGFIPAVLEDGSMELHDGAAEFQAPTSVENLSESDELIPMLDGGTVKRVKDTKAEAPTLVETFSETDAFVADQSDVGDTDVEFTNANEHEGKAKVATANLSADKETIGGTAQSVDKASESTKKAKDAETESLDNGSGAKESVQKADLKVQRNAYQYIDGEVIDFDVIDREMRTEYISANNLAGGQANTVATAQVAAADSNTANDRLDTRPRPSDVSDSDVVAHDKTADFANESGPKKGSIAEFFEKVSQGGAAAGKREAMSGVPVDSNEPISNTTQREETESASAPEKTIGVDTADDFPKKDLEPKKGSIADFFNKVSKGHYEQSNTAEPATRSKVNGASANESVNDQDTEKGMLDPLDAPIYTGAWGIPKHMTTTRSILPAVAVPEVSYVHHDPTNDDDKPRNITSVAQSAAPLETHDSASKVDEVVSDDDMETNDDLEMPPRTKSVNSNTEFVDGLDDIDKFLEAVDPPDELDVGAAGSSIQEVLIGQSAQILFKRLRLGWHFVKRKTVVAKSKLDQFIARRRDEDGKITFVTRQELETGAEKVKDFCLQAIRACRDLLDSFMVGEGMDDYSLDRGIDNAQTKLSSLRQRSENGAPSKGSSVDDDTQGFIRQSLLAKEGSS